ncbi:MAG: response regulator, partial [Flavobacteriales bacterium]
IFERFTQAESSTTRVYGGTGLGLNIVKSLTDLQGGTVKLNSVVGKGSEFIIELPFTIASDEQLREVSDPDSFKQDHHLNGMELLLVEDNEHNQFLATTYLERNGAKVETAVNGKLALDVLRKKSFDAILMDIQMPEMDGNETTIKIRKELKLDVPIIACSAHALESEKQRCLSNGMNEYITKPYNEREMVHTLAKYFNKSKKGDPSIMQAADMKMVTASDVIDSLHRIESKEGKVFAGKLVEMFNRSAEGLVEDIEKYANAKAWDELQKKAHYTAGVLSNFPFMDGVKRSRHLEAMAKVQNEAVAQKAATELIDYLKSCFSQLNQQG